MEAKSQRSENYRCWWCNFFWTGIPNTIFSSRIPINLLLTLHARQERPFGWFPPYCNWYCLKGKKGRKKRMGNSSSQRMNMVTWMKRWALLRFDFFEDHLWWSVIVFGKNCSVLLYPWVCVCVSLSLNACYEYYQCGVGLINKMTSCLDCPIKCHPEEWPEWILVVSHRCVPCTHGLLLASPVSP